MFQALARSWRLSQQSIGVLRKDPELMLFPVISFVSGIVVAGVIGGLGFAVGGFGENGATGLGALFILLFYFVTYFAAIYFQVALVASVKFRLAGGNPNIGYGVRESNKRLWAIVTWAAIAAIVGLLLRLLEEAVRRNTRGVGSVVAQVIIGLVGMAWSLAVFFVIPVIVYEGVDGIEAIKRSTAVVRKRWGEAVVGQGGIGLVMILLAIAVGAVFGGLGVLVWASGGGPAFGILFIGVAVLGILFIIALASTLQSIYTAVLYQYATTGQAGQGFPADVLERSFRAAPPRGGNWGS